MGKVILFSNVSNSEPIHPYNYYDGAMFHICRNIHPDVVYLYCSKEILDKKINVKCKECIKLLDEKIEIKEFEKKYLKDADDFDFYYKDFEKCINDIKKEQNIKEDDILYLNLTSGTSAMISALITLKVLAFNEAKFIQVKAPESHKNDYKDLTVENLWENCKDNKEGIENRCKDVYIPSQQKLWLEDTIKSHLKKYNYTAAYELARDTRCKYFSERYIKYLEGAKLRNELNVKAAKDCFPEDVWNEIFPVLSKQLINCFEYILSLDIKCKRGEFADFIRALSPIIFELLVKVLSKFGFKLDRYTTRNKKGLDVWNKDIIIPEHDLYKVLKNAEQELSNKSHEFSYGNIKSYQLIAILNNYLDLEDEIKEKVIYLAKELRKVEDKARNPVAHQIEIVDRKFISEKVGMNVEDICNYLKNLFGYSGYHKEYSEEIWNCYERMNEWIIKQIENK